MSSIPSHTYAAFWQVGNGFSSRLILRNKDTVNAMTANVSLFSPSGEVVGKRQVKVGPNAVTSQDLGGILLRQSKVAQWGGVRLEFVEGSASKSMGNVIIENENQGTLFDVNLQGGYRYNTDRALYASWWLPDDRTEGKITLFNISQQEITVTPSLAIESGERATSSIRLAAHETQTLSLRQLLAQVGLQEAVAGALIVRYTGEPHALAPALLLANSQTGLSLSMSFNAKHETAAPAHVTNWQFGNVLLATPSTLGFNTPQSLTAYVLVSNGTGSSILPDVRVHIQHESGVTTESLSMKPLQAFETRLINIRSELSRGQVSLDVPYLSMVVSHAGSPGDLAITVFSVNNDQDFITRAESTVHPAKIVDSSYWDISNNLISLLTVQNPSGVDIQAKPTVLFSTISGVSSYVLPSVWVPAGGVKMVDLKPLLSTGAPDRNGHLFPVSVKFGTLTLEVEGTSSAGVVFGGTSVFDPRRGGYGFGEFPPNCDLCSLCEDCIEETDTGGDCVPSCSDPDCCPPPAPPIPDHLMVLSDVIQTQNCGSNSPSSLLRKILYEIQDQYYEQFSTPIAIRENVPPTTSSCDARPVSVSTVCTVNILIEPGVVGEFNDNLFPGCPNLPTNSPCGFIFANQQFQWCPSGSTPQPMGTIGPVNAQNTLINVDGNVLGWLPGKIFAQ